MIEQQGEAILDKAVLDLPSLLSIVKDLWERAEGTSGEQSTDRKHLWPRTRWRRSHFHNLPEADPPMKPPYHEAQKFQSDAPRRVHAQLKARLTENHFLFSVNPPRPTSALNKDANELEIVLNAGVLLLEDRENINIQGQLADGQIRDYAGILHWTMASHIWPKVPSLEEIDDLPEDEEGQTYTGGDGRKADRYEDMMGYCPGCDGTGQAGETEKAPPCPECEGMGMAVPKGQKRYRETDGSLADRRKWGQAKAGFPFFVECPHPGTVFWLEDRSVENGLGMVMRIQRTKLLTYASKLAAEKDRIILSCNEVEKGLRVYGEKDLALGATETPNLAHRGGEDVTICQLWTRDECYELAHLGAPVGGTSDSWTPVKHFKHPYGMPPFAIAAASEINDPDPVLRYEPALEGVYRMKVIYDRLMTLMMVISEMIALPLFYLEDTATGVPMLTEEGNFVTFTRESLLAQSFPAGKVLKKLDWELNPAFVQTIEAAGVLLKDAEPDTGSVPVEGHVQPWSLRLLQTQSAVYPGMMSGNQAKAITIMGRNWAYVMSLTAEEGGFGETVYVYKWDKESGQVDRSTVVGVEPGRIKSLDVRADINAVNAAEQVTLLEHGRQMLADPNVGMTPIEFIENYEHKPNPEAVLANRMAWQAFKEFIYPGLIKQEIAKVQGSQVVLGPDFELIGPDGNSIDSADALSRTPEGRKVLEQWAAKQAQEQAVMGNGQGGAVPPAPMNGAGIQTEQPAMGTLAAPQSMPIRGPG